MWTRNDAYVRSMEYWEKCGSLDCCELGPVKGGDVWLVNGVEVGETYMYEQG
jgi:hypothetical protein